MGLKKGRRQRHSGNSDLHAITNALERKKDSVRCELESADTVITSKHLTRLNTRSETLIERLDGVREASLKGNSTVEK